MIRSVIEILYSAACPNHEPTTALVREVLDELGLDAEVREVPVETAEEARSNRFIGSPSVRIDGQDLERDADHRTDYGLCCRIYEDGGVPPKHLLEERLRSDNI